MLQLIPDKLRCFFDKSEPDQSRAESDGSCVMTHDKFLEPLKKSMENNGGEEVNLVCHIEGHFSS